MDKESIKKCIEACDAAIEMNGSRYALVRISFVKQTLVHELNLIP